MTNRLKNRTPEETFSGNAAGGLYHGTGEFLGRFCFEGGDNMEKTVSWNFFDELHSEATLCLKRLEWLLNQIEDSGDNTMIWDVGCAVIRDADNQFNEIWDKNRKASNL